MKFATHPNQAPPPPGVMASIRAAVWFMGLLGAFIGVMAVWIGLDGTAAQCLPFAILSEALRKAFL